MRTRSSIDACLRMLLIALAAGMPIHARAATITVPDGGDLQAAINVARPGDTILLAPGATYVGNFKLPVHGGTTYITIRSAADDALLPGAGTRMSPAYAPYLPKLRSSNSVAALRTAPGAAFWRLQFLELQANYKGQGDILMLGDGSSAQNTLESVPHHLIVDRVYVHGDALLGQKRGIGLNSGDTTIINSHVSDIKAVGQDTQAIGGWNGPGPYRIENNYLEASTEVLLIGGDDPKIPNLTPSDIIVRNNTLRRPVSWRDPIVPAPDGVRATISGDGALLPGTYAYRVVARRPAGTATAKSAASAETTVTVGEASRIALAWNAVPDATDYVVYGRTPGAVNQYWIVPSPAFVDDGTTAGTAGTPAKATLWQVKNLFELKNAQRVQVDHNVMENNWQHAQNGFAVLLTPRNQYGGCTWCVVRDVTFEHNVVRHVGGGVNLLGQDYINPSQQTTNIVIRHNEFSDISKAAWGGSGYFMTISDQPGKVVVDHNTIVSPSGGGVITVSGPAISGFEFTNNVARHQTYGIFGANVGSGNAAIATYFPDGTFARNVLAGGAASKYPAGNEFPTVADFEAHFADYASADYSLKPATDWAGAGTDGLDLGAGYVPEVIGGAVMEPPQIVTTALAETTEFESYGANIEAAGGVAPYRWSVVAGALPAGIVLDALTGTLSGAAGMAGDHAFTIQVADAGGATATQPLSLRVHAYVAPVSIVTSQLAPAIATVPFAQSLEASGGLGAYAWSIVGGALPEGLALSADGTVSGTTGAAGVHEVVIAVSDAAAPARSASRAFVLTVEPPPNQAPAVTLSIAGGSPVRLGAAVTLEAQPVDVDGWIEQVEFYRDGEMVGTAAAAPFTVRWVASTPGPFRFTARAVDNRGGVAVSAEVVLDTTSEVVLHAADASAVAGTYQVVADATAAGGTLLWDPNLGASKRSSALAAPATYVEFTFYAEAGRPYQLWVRGRAERNSWANDSVYVQFDQVAAARIGTTAALTLTLEEDVNAGLAGWGWQDHGFGTGVIGTPITFEATGPQTIRVQPREDGFSFDQIVISPERYLTAAPGAPKNDATIVAK